MNRLAGTAAVAALLIAGGTCAATAAPVYLGAFSGVSQDDSVDFGAKTTGSFDDVYGFTLTNPSASDFVVSISITNGYSSTQKIFSPFTLSLFDSLDGTGTVLKTASATTIATSGQTGYQIASIYDALGTGSYSFSVSGDSSDSPSYGGSISVDVSAVPLPASAPLLGTAILALGLVGFGAKRRKSTLTA